MIHRGCTGSRTSDTHALTHALPGLTFTYSLFVSGEAKPQLSIMPGTAPSTPGTAQCLCPLPKASPGSSAPPCPSMHCSASKPISPLATTTLTRRPQHVLTHVPQRPACLRARSPPRPRPCPATSALPISNFPSSLHVLHDSIFMYYMTWSM